MINIRTFALAALCIFTTSAFSQKNYKLKANVDKEYNNNKVYLSKMDSGKTMEPIVIDSTTVKNGQFFFTENINPSINQLRLVSIGSVNSDPFIFIADEGNIDLAIMSDGSKISGTKQNNELQAFLDKESSIIETGNAIVQNFDNENASEDLKDKTTEELNEIKNNFIENRFSYINQNIDKEQGEYMLLSSIGFFTPDVLSQLFEKTKPSFKNSEIGKNVSDYLGAQLAKTPGKQFKDLTLNDQNDKIVKLSDYVGKGKVVLIDFWASWCGPCIRTMPELVATYNKYKNKNFEIIGISLDEKKDAWVNATKRLNMTWPQMSDLKGWESKATSEYGVNAIPMTLLVDKDGTIIGMNLSDAELNTKLDEILN